MKKEDVKIGQIWRRKDGRTVKITDEAKSRGVTVFEIVPLGKGRKSWKWSGGIVSEFEFVGYGEEHKP